MERSQSWDFLGDFGTISGIPGQFRAIWGHFPAIWGHFLWDRDIFGRSGDIWFGTGTFGLGQSGVSGTLATMLWDSSQMLWDR